MASGDTLFVFTNVDYNSNPTNEYATQDTFTTTTGIRGVMKFNGYSTDTGQADQTAIAAAAMPAHYDGGGVNVVPWYTTDGVEGDPIKWQVAIEGLSDGDEVDTGTGNPDFGTATDITDSPSTTAYVINKCSPGSISHANMGSPSAGDPIRFKINNDFNYDTGASDNLLLERVVITEQ